jgi:hypothetical protein
VKNAASEMKSAAAGGMSNTKEKASPVAPVTPVAAVGPVAVGPVGRDVSVTSGSPWTCVWPLVQAAESARAELINTSARTGRIERFVYRPVSTVNPAAGRADSGPVGRGG